MIKTKHAPRRKPAARAIARHKPVARAIVSRLDASILVVDDEGMMRKVIGRSLSDAGCDVVYAANGEEALAKLNEALPDLVISDVNMPRMDGFELLTRIRAQPATKALPVILLTGRGETEDVVAGMGLGADDYLIKPFALAELMARVRAKIERPPVPAASLERDRPTGLLSETRFSEEVEREVARARKTRRGGVLAHIGLHELALLRARFSSRVQDQIELQAVHLIAAGAGPLDVMAHDEQVRFMLLMPETSEAEARSRLAEMMERIAGFQFTAGDEVFQLTPVVAFVEFGVESEAAELGERCSIAMEHAELQLDLRPVRYLPTMRALAQKPRTPIRSGMLHLLVTIPGQIAISQVLAIVLPLAAYLLLDALGVDIVPVAYVVVVIALVATAILIWTEGMLALRPKHPPRLSEQGYVPATAIIAAYLPNEAATIVETVRAFQRIDYPAGLQIVLAYNTPRPMPVEEALREIARADGRFKAMRVEGSESKAQNVNAALSEATGEFIGIFDADHHPDPHCFRRAWRWLASGYDIVQGHCMVRNGDETWVSRMVAVEFEAIYAVSHPGRARLHDFGIFGGSNGYWKARLLHETRMHAFMLTEDIDSSVRAVLEGRRIASDPFLVSRELAPVTLRALWNQRMRWAQGWFQVSYRYLFLGLASGHVTFRQKLGLVHLLIWRETYPWIANQMIPIIIFWTIKFGGLDRIDWLVPIFVMTTIFTLGTGPAQTMLAWRLAHRDIRRHPAWFLSYLVMSSVFYTAFKNLIAVVAQLNEAMQQRRWMVTPRTARAAATAAMSRPPAPVS
jgi:PleD family two-component response regulator/cellulose synthase/poly-beta-1,6-N-acetylglucosamine synthase-like glycosyltransferase